MPIPESIRSVPRPVNTIVQDNGRDGPKRYSVRQRKGTHYVKGGNPRPENGKVIGYIYENKFVPRIQAVQTNKPEELSFGGAALIRKVGSDLLRDLLNVFDPADSARIFCMAALRVLKPKIANSRLASAYERSFLRVFWPGVSLSANTVSNFLKHLGMAKSRQKDFFQLRLAQVQENSHILIDGTLIQNTSVVNDLSSFSYKARVKGCMDISVLYAYDPERQEPICAQVFPGNSIDANSYRQFIQTYNIQKGIIIADKGFPPAQILDELKERKQLHFLTPLKRNDKCIVDSNALEFDGVLKGTKDPVRYAKRRLDNGHFLYAFKDTCQGRNEEKTYLIQQRQNNSYSDEEFRQKQEKFGLIVLESDQDLSAELVYACYEERWLLELVFKMYKSAEGLDRTRVHSDYSVFGSEFVNFIATVLSCKILKEFRRSGLLKQYTYGQLIEDLNAVWRETNAPIEAYSNDPYWCRSIKYYFPILERLGLSKQLVLQEPSKPKKAEPKQLKPKRPRGRPRKKAEPEDTEKPKRPRGRPRIHPQVDKPKRPRGRPRKIPTEAT